MKFYEVRQRKVWATYRQLAVRGFTNSGRKILGVSFRYRKHVGNARAEETSAAELLACREVGPQALDATKVGFYQGALPAETAFSRISSTQGAH